jgi:hypothetical protein
MLVDENDSLQRTIVRNAIRGDTGSSNHSSKSTKLPDPDQLDDGQNPSFKSWLAEMRSKFDVNRDHYDTESARIGKAKVFTKLDIRQAFHRIRMNPESEELTTFRTRYGQYKCKVLPFGLTNGPATYQRYMNDVLFEYLDDFCIAYLDDILIYSENPEEHEIHVRKVLEKLRLAGL